MQEINITRIIGAVEGFLESSLFLEKQHLNTIAESLLLKGLFTVLVLIATAIALRGRRGGYAKRHRTRTGKQRFSKNKKENMTGRGGRGGRWQGSPKGGRCWNERRNVVEILRERENVGTS